MAKLHDAQPNTRSRFVQPLVQPLIQPLIQTFTQSLMKHLSAYVLGQTCAACALPCVGDPVCAACAGAIRTAQRCPSCGIRQFSGSLCGACAVKPPPFEALWCVGDFTEPLAPLIAQLKFQKRLVLARWLAGQMQARLSDQPTSAAIDWLIPIPLHAERQKSRGFNQAWELGKYLPYPAAPQALLRTRDTPSQRSVGAQARFANMKHAFAVAPQWQPALAGKHVLLVDDVVTTTATVTAASAALKAAGVARVSVVCVARAGQD